MQAWPDLWGCTGVAWDVTNFGARAFFRMAGVAGTAGACFIWVPSGAGAADMGCMHGAGGGDAGCAAKKWWLHRACVNHLDTAFMKVCSCAAVCGTIAGAY